jgi:hypothetical protein
LNTQVSDARGAERCPFASDPDCRWLLVERRGCLGSKLNKIDFLNKIQDPELEQDHPTLEQDRVALEQDRSELEQDHQLTVVVAGWLERARRGLNTAGSRTQGQPSVHAEQTSMFKPGPRMSHTVGREPPARVEHAGSGVEHVRQGRRFAAGAGARFPAASGG